MKAIFLEIVCGGKWKKSKLIMYIIISFWTTNNLE